MRYLTDRKRATGMGSAKSGTAHFWAMKVSSVALLILIPLFVFTFGTIVGEDYATVTAYFAHPFPALIAALTLIVGFEHFQSGAQVLIEDYVHGFAQKITIILIKCISYGLMAMGLFAIAKLAL
ncbi:MAG: succinate dehydrogenase, hydrophobic membrane anchor protein [Rhodobacteraceae bacterium]|jgi:succinate dehydrogenase / fumarate reductase membrane anchor subunit|nr:succinate dehydrogenase, hydrophobic membrane anchor protein [Paracoccaceae bacterium]NCV30191.1 succinate dehydrogenase, hydrophobic membrane anchor protein [Paracoccaceae bacterium]NCV68435.1 succinate dehydrogenase, hydrophobic membrane anchor protein [Paracoccaceae bacterium]NCW04245.1 succinate dehydrogenase, hydrophobic membrane anchor protein [Paracoccaceae bacterium]NCW61367.1 succinate dehydrogenase, hydrophobic membrane anchor protein [Paracoccaceae bacterium]